MFRVITSQFLALSLAFNPLVAEAKATSETPNDLYEQAYQTRDAKGAEAVLRRLREEGITKETDPDLYRRIESIFKKRGFETGETPRAAAAPAAAPIPGNKSAVRTGESATILPSNNYTLSDTEPPPAVIGREVAPSTEPESQPDAREDNAIVLNPTMSVEKIKALIAEDPEYALGHIAIGKARLKQDITKLEDYSKERTGMSLVDYDTARAKRAKREIENQDTASPFIDALVQDNYLIKDVATVNAELKRQYPRSTTEELIDILVSKARWYTAGLGTVEGAVIGVFGANYKKVTGLASLSSFEAARYAVNINLVNQIADLYGVRLSKRELETFVVAAWSMGKYVARYRRSGYTFNEMKRKMGQMATSVLQSSKPSDMARLLGESAKRLTEAYKAGKQGLPPQVQELAEKVVKDTATVPENDGKSSKPEDKAKLQEGEAKAARLVRSGSAYLFVKHIGLHASMSFVETEAAALGASFLFERVYNEQRKHEDADFRRLLMTQEIGEGLYRLLAGALFFTKEVKPLQLDPEFTSDPLKRNPQVNFILNVARSARTCSPADKKLIDLWEDQNYPSTFTEKLQGLAKKLDSTTAKVINATWGYIDPEWTGLDDNEFEYLLAKSACAGNVNFDQYNRLRVELMTFNGVSQDYVPNLRFIEKRNYQIKMAEILLQMMAIDGDFSPKEMEYFNKVARPVLGLTDTQDTEFFQQMMSYIKDHNIVPQPKSPTGYAIGPTSEEPPYYLGFTSLRAPRPPDSLFQGGEK